MTDYDLILSQLSALTEDERSPLPGLANCSALLYEAMEDLNWCGFYLTVDSVDSVGSDLLLGPFQGRPACIRIPFGKGVCGTAAKTVQTQLVYDVHQFPGHIACDAASRSEVVVPLIKNGQVLGVLDIDSPLIGRFTEEDRTGLEKVCRLLLERIDL